MPKLPLKTYPLALLLAILALCSFNQAQTSPPSTKVPENGKSISLQSTQAAKAATNPPAQAQPIPQPQPKPVAIVLRNVWALEYHGQPLLIVPERYLSDLTNIYRVQFLPQVRLEEP